MRNPIQWPPSSPRAQLTHVIPSSNPIPSTRVGLRGERREKKEEVAKSREGKDHAAMQQRYAATPSPAPSSGKAQLSGAATHHFLQLFDFRSRPTEYAPLLYLYKASIFKLKKTTIRTKARAQPTRLQKQLHTSTKTHIPSRRSVCGDKYRDSLLGTPSQVHNTFGNGRGTILGPPSLSRFSMAATERKKWRCSCTMGTLRTRRSSSRLRRLVGPNGNIAPGA
ncbi:hypothetical protein CABS01_06693 [Colletotrichum abscissum]|uniref:uncharacterized protein n=1 Tax=Colletotrichum abscissum TaxID=1671311 RepID=UPI0027D5376A|nr:uncharacterized protein CABS01_06693 [Colletotrichum abscissum]KAK1514714.1 hypothetical protein CABS01_06693 [Colletotrichum abscissum]